MRIPILSAIVACAMSASYAQEAFETPQVDSSFVHSDTLELFVDNNKEKYIYHRSENPVNVFELAAYYGCMSRDILDAERFTRRDSQEIKAYLIPAQGFQINTQDCFTHNCVPVLYTVRPQETVYRIARKYFDLKVEDLKALNNLETNDLYVGQRLVVGWFTPNTYKQAVPTNLALMPDIPEDPFHPEIPKTQVGVAYWNKAQTDYSNMFALHRRARLNSMIEITNPMMKKRVLVKVVGRIPPTYTSDIELVVSPAVATRLGVLDPRFRAEMKFVE